jgi:hypothetical protein
VAGASTLYVELELGFWDMWTAAIEELVGAAVGGGEAMVAPPRP